MIYVNEIVVSGTIGSMLINWYLINIYREITGEIGSHFGNYHVQLVRQSKKFEFE